MAQQPPREKPLPELKTPVALGIDGVPIYARNISDDSVAEIKAKLPRDIDGVRVEPYVGNNEIRSHFRVVGTPVPGTSLRRKETSKEHRKTQAALLRHLDNAKYKVDFFTGGPPNKFLLRPNVPLLSLEEGSNYEWVEEPETRIWMTNQEYLQPDIAGRDKSRFSASPTYRSVIVEVVHHHWPDEKTWDHLVQLSKMNYLVAFYCITEDLFQWTMSAYKVVDQPRLSIHVQLYLKEGQLYEGVSPVPIFGATPVERNESIRGYLAGIKKKYLKEYDNRIVIAAEWKKKKAEALAAKSSSSLE